MAENSVGRGVAELFVVIAVSQSDSVTLFFAFP